MDAAPRFLFDTCFDPEQPKAVERRPEPAPEPEPEAPSFSEAELQAARQEGFAQGQDSGRQEALAGLEQAAAAALKDVAQQGSTLLDEQRAGAEMQRLDALSLSIKAVETLFPTLLGTAGQAEVEAAIRETLGGLDSEPRVVIRAAEPVAETLGERLTALAAESGYEGRLVLIPDTEMTQGAVRVEWASGGAERDCAELWQALRARIEAHFGAPITDQEPITDHDRHDGESGTDAEPDMAPADPAPA